MTHCLAMWLVSVLTGSLLISTSSQVNAVFSVKPTAARVGPVHPYKTPRNRISFTISEQISCHLNGWVKLSLFVGVLPTWYYILHANLVLCSFVENFHSSYELRLFETLFQSILSRVVILNFVKASIHSIYDMCKQKHLLCFKTYARAFHWQDF